jgi:hypothetical protein
MLQGPGASESHRSSGEIHSGSDDELVNISYESVFNGLEGGTEKGIEFHYAWLLILIALTTWREPKETQFLEGMKKPFLAVRYVSLWHTVHKNRQLDNNITFYIYKETIRKCIEDTSHIQP